MQNLYNVFCYIAYAGGFAAGNFTGICIEETPAQGTTDKVYIVYSVIKRSALKDVVAIIKRFNPKAFYSIEDVKFACGAIFPLIKPGNSRSIYELIKLRRKGNNYAETS